LPQEVIMRTGAIGIVVLGLVLVSPTARSEESKVELGDVPKGGMEAVKKMFPQATVEGAAKETEDGKTVFEVTLKQQGRNIDVTVGTDGKIQVVEKQIADKDLPATVKRALDAKYPKATYKVIEEVDAMKDGKPVLDFFEAHLITADKQSTEVQITPDGKIKAEEKKKPGDND
jgi:hypothetical protein